MKDSLFDILFNLFERTLTHLKEAKDPKGVESGDNRTVLNKVNLKTQAPDSIRIFSESELIRFTKPGYQFLVKIMRAKIIHPAIMEQIIHTLVESDSRFVSLQETKWTLRNKIAGHLDSKDLAFLDLVLYQKEDGLPVH